MMNKVIRAISPELMQAVRQHCERDHYLHRYPDPRSLPFAYTLFQNETPWQSDGRLNGLVVFKKPQHHKQRGLFGYAGLPTAWQVLDLARVWIHPALQQPGMNVFSQMVSACIRQVQRDWLDHHPPRYPALPYHIELIISYADLRYHTGIAYRASNFTLHGIADGKALYTRHLKPPRWKWQPRMATAQLPLFEGMALKY